MRKWHRWLSIPALIFLIVVSISGLILQVQGFLNEDEEKTEQLENQKSKILLSSALNYSGTVEAAQKILISKTGDVVIKKIEIEFRQDPSVVSVYTDEKIPRIFQIDAKSGQIISEKLDNSDKFWIKLHSGELYGDFGRSTGIFSGLALLFFSISGFWIYFQMYKRRPKQGPLWKRIFW